MQPGNDKDNSIDITDCFAAELLASLINHSTFSNRVSPVLLDEMRLAGYSVKSRWDFINSRKFKISIIAYFSISTIVNHFLNIPIDTLGLVLEILTVTACYITVLTSAKSIPEVLSASTKNHSPTITRIQHALLIFSSHIQITDSPPPRSKLFSAQHKNNPKTFRLALKLLFGIGNEKNQSIRIFAPACRNHKRI